MIPSSEGIQDWKNEISILLVTNENHQSGFLLHCPTGMSTVPPGSYTCITKYKRQNRLTQKPTPQLFVECADFSPKCGHCFRRSLVGSLPISLKMTSFYLKYVRINNLIDLSVHYEARNKNYPLHSLPLLFILISL